MGRSLFADTLRKCVADLQRERCCGHIYRSGSIRQRFERDGDRYVSDRYNQDGHGEYHRPGHPSFCCVSAKRIDPIVSNASIHGNGYIRSEQSRTKLDGDSEWQCVFACLRYVQSFEHGKRSSREVHGSLHIARQYQCELECNFCYGQHKIE